MSQFVINNVLFYIQNARDSDTTVQITRTAGFFYKYESICDAKDRIFKEIGEEDKIVRRRDGKRQDKSTAEIEDILNAFSTAEAKEVNLPTFAAVGRNALPPTDGHEFIMDALDSIMTEVRSLGSELASAKEQQVKEDFNVIAKGLHDMRTEMRENFRKFTGNSSDNSPSFPPEMRAEALINNSRDKRETSQNVLSKNQHNLANKQNKPNQKVKNPSGVTPSVSYAEKAKNNAQSNGAKTGTSAINVPLIRQRTRLPVVRGTRQNDSELVGAQK